MPFTADDIKEAILIEVGDVVRETGDAPASPQAGLLYNQIDSIWDRYAAKDQVAPGLRALYTKRDCLRIILGVLAQKRFDSADVLAGMTFKVGQIWTHYQDLLTCCKDEIASVEKKFGGSSTFRAGRMVTRAPVTPYYPPDANNPRYGGSPYRGRRRS